MRTRDPADRGVESDHEIGGCGLMRRMMLVVLLGFMTASAAAAQKVPGRARIWAAVGLGAGMPTSGGDGIGKMAQLVFEKEPHHVAIRAVVLHDLDSATDAIAELGALYGRTRVFDWGHAALAGGVSAVAFDTCPDDDDSCVTVGVPLVAEVALSRNLVGLGLQAFGNYNRKAAYAGAALFLQFGRL